MSRIVVIEDNALNARMVDKLLSRAGHDVVLAEDGEIGFNAVLNNQPDLILIDLGLPDIDGQTIIGMLRMEEVLTGVPIIAFTAWPQEAAFEMAQAYGCDGIITKPINTRTFASEINSYLDKTQQPTSGDLA
jgi:CheY-like chemotaxis protein